MDRNIYPLLMAELRSRMKARKLTYADLGKKANIPAATVKKWFATSDGALSRVTRLCPALGTTLQEILATVEHQTVRTITMGQKQQAYFLSDYRAFEVYWLLVYERRSIAEIREALGMREVEVRRRLLKLDKLELISYGLDDKAKVPKVVPVRWTPEGLFIRQVFKAWMQSIITDGLKSTDQSDIILQYMQLTDQSEAEFRKDLIALEEKYARRTIHEMQLNIPNLNASRFLAVRVKGRFRTRETSVISDENLGS